MYYEYFFFHGLCQWCDIDGDGGTICKTDLILFGASKSALVYAYPYMMIYLSVHCRQ